jgi:hypothetical protein
MVLPIVVCGFHAYCAFTYRYVHVLADAYPILTDPCLGLSTEYPWAMTIATAASLFTFTLEWVLHKTFRRRLIEDERNIHDVKRHDAEAPLPALSAGPGDDVLEAADHKARLKALQNVVISYTFEAGIIFHSKQYCSFPVRVFACLLSYNCIQALPGMR